MAGLPIMGLVGGFIAVAIMLGIGTLILGGAATDCTTITGFNATIPNATSHPTVTVDNQQTGWPAQCITNNTQSQSGYGLLIITLIVLAAVVVLSVVRMLA